LCALGVTYRNLINFYLSNCASQKKKLILCGVFRDKFLVYFV
jgi:hypothetical protein